MSPCGNYVVVGYASGRIDRYNIQSGQRRRTYTGHTKAVTALAVDAVNRRIVSTSLDGTVKVRRALPPPWRLQQRVRTLTVDRATLREAPAPVRKTPRCGTSTLARSSKTTLWAPRSPCWRSTVRATSSHVPRTTSGCGWSTLTRPRLFASLLGTATASPTWSATLPA